MLLKIAWQMFLLLEIFLPTELFLIYHILMWSRSRGRNREEIESCLSTKLSSWNKIGNSFSLAKVSPSTFAVNVW